MAPRKAKSVDEASDLPEVFMISVPGNYSESAPTDPPVTHHRVAYLESRVTSLELLNEQNMEGIDQALSDLADAQSAISNHTDEIEGLQRKALNPRQESSQEPSHGPMVAIAVGVSSLFSLLGGRR